MEKKRTFKPPKIYSSHVKGATGIVGMTSQKMKNDGQMIQFNQVKKLGKFTYSCNGFVRFNNNLIEKQNMQ